MPELNKILEKDQNNGQGSSTDDVTSLNSKLEEETKKRETTEAELADERFNGQFNQLSGIYPHAKDFREVIREKVKNGYTVDDAVVSVLKKEDKLITAEQIAAENNKGDGLGGSAETGDLSGQNKGEKTLADYEQEFKDAEARGDIKIS